MLSKAKKLLIDNNARLVIIKNDITTSSNERGIKALLEILDSNSDFSGAYAADKVVGKAAATVYVLLKIKALYAKVISEGAKEIIKANGIYLEYDESVPYIVNRAGNGMCPMEEAVGNECDPEAAVKRVRKRLEQLLKSN